jgi:Cu-Zn family superoxide dismutase
MRNASYVVVMPTASNVVRALVGAVFAMGCGGSEFSLKADLEPTHRHDVRGAVLFEPAEGGVRVRADVRGLGGGRHGFHVHEVGDCSAPDATNGA